MTNGLPLFLITETRLVFRQCALQRKSRIPRRFDASPLVLFRASSNRHPITGQGDPLPDRQRPTLPVTDSSVPIAKQKPYTPSVPASRGQPARELVPQRRDGRSVGASRTVDAPMKIIPKAEIAPNLRLSPQERLHIEILTRRPPPVIRQVKPYKERLLIYHPGNVTETASIFLKVLGLMCAGVVTLIIVPAHYSAGHSLWLCGSLLLAGWFPCLFFHRLLRPLVTSVHLRLPPNARASPQTAMAYARNLPATAQIDISFTRITSIPGTVTANLSELHPIPKASRWPWQFANVRWRGQNIDRGSRLRPNPTEFLVNPEVGPGRARRNVIPGIWPNVYDRLTGVTREEASKWQRV